MLVSRNYLRQNIISCSIVVFLFILSIVIYVKPGFLFDHKGCLREFGINSKKRTVIPMWLLCIILSIISYLFVLYYITIPRFR